MPAEAARDWALASARALRPVNHEMNSRLNAAKRADRLDAHLDELRARLPAGAIMIGGEGDSRPAGALRRVGAALGCEVVIVPGAGHQPWLEAPERFGAVLRGAVKHFLPG